MIHEQHRARDSGNLPDVNEHPREENGALYFCEDGRCPRLYVLARARLAVLGYHHDDVLAGHPGIHETRRTIHQEFYLPRMRQDIRRHVFTCQRCNLAKAAKPAAAGHQVPRKPKRPWENVALDIKGALSEDGAR